MNDRKKLRQSNIELLRIVAMLMIIAYHFVVHGANNVVAYSFSLERMWINLFSMCGKLGVNLFVLITGYFGIKQQFSFKKLFNIEGMQLFYSVTIMVAFLIYEGSLDRKQMVMSLFPTIFDEYWFVSAYIILYLLTPFVNRFCLALEKNNFKHLIGLTFVLWSIIPFFSIRLGDGMYYTQFLWMIVTYIIGAYIRLHYQDVKEGIKVKGVLLTWKSVFGISIMIDIIYIIMTVFLGRYNITFVYYSTYASYGSNSPIIICAAIALFLCFLKMNIGNKTWINSLASAALPVYLLHENKWFSPWFWGKVTSWSEMMSMPALIIYSLFIVIMVYAMGYCCNYLRLLLCRLFAKPIVLIEKELEKVFHSVLKLTKIIP